MADRPIIFSAPLVRALLAGRKTQTRRLVKPAPQTFAVDGQPCEVALEYGEGEPWPRVRLGRVITRQEVRYRPGLRLWVRERCRAEEVEDGTDGVRYAADGAWVPIANTQDASDAWGALYYYRGRGKDRIGNAVPSIHMPRWASRITLTLTEVKLQRLHDLTDEDAVAEGATSREACAGFLKRDAGWSMDWSRVGEMSPFATGAMRGQPAPLAERDVALCSPRWAFASYWDAIHGVDAWDRNPVVVALSFSVERRNISHG